jgi:hypothetical protein
MDVPSTRRGSPLAPRLVVLPQCKKPFNNRRLIQHHEKEREKALVILGEKALVACRNGNRKFTKNTTTWKHDTDYKPLNCFCFIALRLQCVADS